MLRYLQPGSTTAQTMAGTGLLFFFPAGGSFSTLSLCTHPASFSFPRLASRTHRIGFAAPHGFWFQVNFSSDYHGYVSSLLIFLHLLKSSLKLLWPISDSYTRRGEWFYLLCFLKTYNFLFVSGT